MAERANDLQIVADEEVGEPAPALQVAQEVDDLPLHGKIERRGRLVEQDEFRVEHQRAGNGDALALPAGEFVREAVERVRIEPDIDQRAADALVALAALPPIPLTISPSSMICFTDRRGLSDENGSWKTTCMLRPERPHLGLRFRVEAFALPVDRATVIVQQPQDGLAERGLAGAGLADDAERLAALQSEAHVVDRDQQARSAG